MYHRGVNTILIVSVHPSFGSCLGSFTRSSHPFMESTTSFSYSFGWIVFRLRFSIIDMYGKCINDLEVTLGRFVEQPNSLPYPYGDDSNEQEQSLQYIFAEVLVFL